MNESSWGTAFGRLAKFLDIIVGLAVWGGASTALAYDKDDGYSIRGVGAQSCGAYSKARRAENIPNSARG